jgi:hypothetical protein
VFPTAAAAPNKDFVFLKSSIAATSSSIPLLLSCFFANGAKLLLSSFDDDAARVFFDRLSGLLLLL